MRQENKSNILEIIDIFNNLQYNGYVSILLSKEFFMAETKGSTDILSRSAKTRFHSIGTKLLFFTVILLLAQYLIIAYKDWRSLKKFSENKTFRLHS